MTERLDELITRFPLFEGYQPFGARRLIERGEVRSLIAGDLLYREGDPASSVALVLKGDLEVFVDRGGRSMTLTHAGPGSILGEIGVLCGIDRTASVRAAEPTTVLQWPDQSFRDMLVSDSTLSQRIFRQSLRTLIEKERSMIEALVSGKR